MKEQLISDKGYSISATGRVGFVRWLLEVWAHRALIIMFTMRNLRSRYAQTGLGVLWTLISPVSYMVVLSLFFGFMARFPTDDIPYPIYLFSGLIFFQFVARCITDGASSLLSNESILGKVYIPRLIFPLSASFISAFDFFVAFCLFVVLLPIFGMAVGFKILLMPLAIMLMLLLGTGFAVLFSALVVKFRDLRPALATISQILFFASPILYPSTMIPQQYHNIWAINPVVGLCELTRWISFEEVSTLNLTVVLISTISAAFVMVTGLLYFRRTERELVDLM